jgi:hypothetical protein
VKDLTTLIDGASQYGFSKIEKSKLIFNNVFGRLGQLNMFKDAAYDLDAQLINSHFAALCGPQALTCFIPVIVPDH